MFSRDGDLLAAHLDLSEIEVGHESQESSRASDSKQSILTDSFGTGGTGLLCLIGGASQLVGSCFHGRFSPSDRMESSDDGGSSGAVTRREDVRSVPLGMGVVEVSGNASGSVSLVVGVIGAFDFVGRLGDAGEFATSIRGVR
jgi:hypothetical protein